MLLRKLCYFSKLHETEYSVSLIATALRISNPKQNLLFSTYLPEFEGIKVGLCALHWYAYHGARAHLNGVLHKFLPLVCVPIDYSDISDTIGIEPQTF
jgi:hypothetical protein